MLLFGLGQLSCPAAPEPAPAHTLPAAAPHPPLRPAPHAAGSVFRLDAALNAACYGPDWAASIDEVLSGTLPPPPEFRPLLDLLESYGGEGRLAAASPGVTSALGIPRTASERRMPPLPPMRSPSSSPRLAALGGGLPPRPARSAAGGGSTAGGSVAASTAGSEAEAAAEAAALELQAAMARGRTRSVRGFSAA